MSVTTDLLEGQLELAGRLDEVFGTSSDPVFEVERRAARLLPGREVIVWEGDPQTFQFSYVSANARRVLGYPVSRWVTEPDFWSATVVHPEDRSAAVAFCALATGQCRDHDFQYRAIAADGREVVLHDVVHVIRGPRGIAARLRGIMIDVTDLEGAGG